VAPRDLAGALNTPPTYIEVLTGCAAEMRAVAAAPPLSHGTGSGWPGRLFAAQASWLDGVRERHTFPGCACRPWSSAPCPEITDALRLVAAWRSRLDYGPAGGSGSAPPATPTG